MCAFVIIQAPESELPIPAFALPLPSSPPVSDHQQGVTNATLPTEAEGDGEGAETTTVLDSLEDDEATEPPPALSLRPDSAKPNRTAGNSQGEVIVGFVVVDSFS